jgi:hypothetical protein
MLATTDVYAAPGQDDLRVAQLMKGGMRIDPLKDFAEAARGVAGVLLAIGRRLPYSATGVGRCII